MRDAARPLARGELTLIVAFVVGAHAVLAVGVARARSAEPVVREQQVVIEVLPPPKPPEPEQAPVVPPQAARPERPRPVARKVVARPQLVPETPAPAPSEEAPALPVGDDPALASESGNGPVAAPPPPPPPAPPAPVRVVQAHEGANYLKNPRPSYPAVAQRRGWQGEVLLRVRVSPDGRAAGAVVQRSSGHDLLDEAAIEAVRSWLFVPARQGGVAVAGFVTVPITFRLQ